jgi:hypothetical protein
MNKVFTDVKSINKNINSENNFNATAYCTKNRFLAKTAELMLTSTYDRQETLMSTLRKQEITNNISEGKKYYGMNNFDIACKIKKDNPILPRSTAIKAASGR